MYMPSALNLSGPKLTKKFVVLDDESNQLFKQLAEFGLKDLYCFAIDAASDFEQFYTSLDHELVNLVVVSVINQESNLMV